MDRGDRRRPGHPDGEVDSTLGLGALPSAGTQAQYLAVGAAGIASPSPRWPGLGALRMRLVAAKSHPWPPVRSGSPREAQSRPRLRGQRRVRRVRGRAARPGRRVRQPRPVLPDPRDRARLRVRTRWRGHVLGAVVGGAYLAWAPTVAESAGVAQPILQGAVLVTALMFLPGGVVLFLGRAVRRLPRRPSGRPADTGGAARRAPAARTGTAGQPPTTCCALRRSRSPSAGSRRSRARPCPCGPARPSPSSGPTARERQPC